MRPGHSNRSIWSALAVISLASVLVVTAAGTAQAKPAQQPDACMLVNAADVTAAFGQKVDLTDRFEGTCSHDGFAVVGPEGGETIVLTTPHMTVYPEAFRARTVAEAKAYMKQGMKKEADLGDPENVTGVGQQAFYRPRVLPNTEGGQSQRIFARKGTLVVTIEGGVYALDDVQNERGELPNKAALVALAQAAFAKP